MIRCCSHSRALSAAWKEGVVTRRSHATACSSSGSTSSSSRRRREWSLPKLPSRSVSSQAGQSEGASSTFFQPSYVGGVELRIDKGKGKARAIDQHTRRTMIGKIAREARVDVEKSEKWEQTTARYPGLRREQLRLVSFLLTISERAKQAGIMILPKELWSLHSIIFEADQARQSRDGSTPLFQRSSVAYTILLKFAHKLQDGNTLKSLAREALRWRHKVAKRTRTPAKGGGFIHPRVAAADQLSRLVRNLFVSLAISQRARLSNGRHKILPGLRLPSSAIKVSRGDEAMTVSAISKHRLGVYSVGQNEEGETTLDLSRFAQVSRNPVSHTSRRRRRLMRLLERGNLMDFQKALVKNGTSPSAQFSQDPEQASRKVSSLPEKEKEGDLSVRKSTRKKQGSADSTGTTLLPFSSTSSSALLPPSYNADMVQLLSQTLTSGSAREEKMKALLSSYEQWHEHLCRRLNARRTLVSTLKQFNISPENVKQEDIDAIRHVIPAWLLLALLRIYIGTGEMKEAERAVAVYLESFQRIHKEKELVDILPYDSARVHAVTSPFIPPNSPSLLNGMLRACISNGGGDCFESMTQIIKRWCYDGSNFSSALLLEKSKKEKKNAKEIGSKGSNEMPQAGRSLLPDSTTVCIMLEALRNRKKKYHLGVKLVHEMWQRWGVIGSPGKPRLDFVEPNRRQKLTIPLRAFTILLSWTLLKNTPNAERKMARVQSMQAVWQSRTSSSTTSSTTTDDHHQQQPSWTHQELHAWNRVRAKAAAAAAAAQATKSTRSPSSSASTEVAADEQ